jgi:hypothetical protein
MKIFLAFMFACFISAVLLRQRSLKLSMCVAFGLTMLLSIGYFFFNQI